MESQSISQHLYSPLRTFSFQTSLSHSFTLSDQQFDVYLQNIILKGSPVFIFSNYSTPFTHPKNTTYQTFPNQEDKSSFMNQKILTYNRKSKSLEELSKKFIQHFQGKGNNLIQLDKITQLLAVQRRRIYDVINILESLNVVRKKGKNNYEWRGLSQALITIDISLKQGQNFKIQNLKKEKSLEYLAAGFLKLFINWRPAISLQQAAKLMMKQSDQVAAKTKIRRLYDIINVFRSLGLVRKASLPSKKPGYQWAGTQYLQDLIIKKQFNDENTGLNQLHQEQEIQSPQEKTDSFLNVKNSIFSPFTCPQIPKSTIKNFNLINDTNQPKDSDAQKSNQKYFSQDLFTYCNQFPKFVKTTSAFSLVLEGKKLYQ